MGLLDHDELIEILQEDISQVELFLVPKLFWRIPDHESRYLLRPLRDSGFFLTYLPCRDRFGI